MRYSNRFTILLLLASALAFSGCRTSHASPSPSSPSPAAARLANPSAAASSAPSPARPSKHPSRDSEFSVYHNPDYGVSFRYPRNYLLQEPEQNEPDAVADGSPFLLTQKELDSTQPGAIVVASVLIPDDAYPNTTFAHGHLQFIVNPQATAESCRAAVGSLDSGADGASGTITAQGIPFDWRLRHSADAGSRFVNAEYAGFSKGSCYEFFIEIADAADTEPDSAAKPADISKILRALEKIVLSFQIHAGN